MPLPASAMLPDAVLLVAESEVTAVAVRAVLDDTPGAFAGLVELAMLVVAPWLEVRVAEELVSPVEGPGEGAAPPPGALQLAVSARIPRVERRARVLGTALEEVTADGSIQAMPRRQ